MLRKSFGCARLGNVRQTAQHDSGPRPSETDFLLLAAAFLMLTGITVAGAMITFITGTLPWQVCGGPAGLFALLAVAFAGADIRQQVKRRRRWAVTCPARRR